MQGQHGTRIAQKRQGHAPIQVFIVPDVFEEREMQGRAFPYSAATLVKSRRTRVSPLLM